MREIEPWIDEVAVVGAIGDPASSSLHYQMSVGGIRLIRTAEEEIREIWWKGLRLDKRNSKRKSPPVNLPLQPSAIDSKALEVQGLLKQINVHKPVNEIDQALNRLEPSLNEDLVLLRHCSDWKSAYIFFNWISNASRYSPGTGSYNEILDILGRMKRFNEVSQLLDEMSKRNMSLYQIACLDNQPLFKDQR
ncbi:hypothetical protein L1887_18116 [Cichorium endivia]|nr:hypothetical protein L1887_18116 [Cichorium endivia]